MAAEHNVNKPEQDHLLPSTVTINWPPAQDAPTVSPMFHYPPQEKEAPPQAVVLDEVPSEQPAVDACDAPNAEPPPSRNVDSPIACVDDQLPSLASGAQHIPDVSTAQPMPVVSAAEPLHPVSDQPIAVEAQVQPISVISDSQTINVDADAEPMPAAGNEHTITVQVQGQSEVAVVQQPLQDDDPQHLPHVSQVPDVSVDEPDSVVEAMPGGDNQTLNADEAHNEAMPGVPDEQQTTVVANVQPISVVGDGQTMAVDAHGQRMQIVTEPQPMTVIAEQQPMTIVAEQQPMTVDSEGQLLGNGTQVDAMPVVSDGQPEPVVTPLVDNGPPLAPPPIDSLDKQPASAEVPPLGPLDDKQLTVAPLETFDKTNMDGAQHIVTKQPDIPVDVSMTDAAQHNGQSHDQAHGPPIVIHTMQPNLHGMSNGSEAASVPATVATSATATPVVSSATVVVTGSAGLDHHGSLNMASGSATLSHLVSPTATTMAFPAGNTRHAGLHGAAQHMELHENGTLLTTFSTGEHHVDGLSRQHGDAIGHTSAVQTSGGMLVSQGMPLHVTQNGAPATQAVRLVTSNEVGGVGQNTAGRMLGPQGGRPMEAPRKATRMPGTKQCPTCTGTIAAAVAKCPLCGHVFRQKKEKPKRSGKRGKKNCPKCGRENPSACSTCKNEECKYVFRLKLMDRYKQMRPRAADGTSQIAAGTPSAGVVKPTHTYAHTQPHSQAISALSTAPPPLPTGPAVSAVPPAPIAASSTIPMQAGVQHYQPSHYPTPVSPIQPLVSVGMQMPLAQHSTQPVSQHIALPTHSMVAQGLPINHSHASANIQPHGPHPQL